MRQNPTCIQYFCCCAYVCAATSAIPLISMIVLITRGLHCFFNFYSPLLSMTFPGDTKIIVTFIISLILFFLYLRAGHLSRQLQQQPYFTNDRLAPRASMHLRQTVECHPQPVAHVEMIPMAPVEYRTTDAAFGDVPVATATAVVVSPRSSTTRSSLSGQASL